MQEIISVGVSGKNCVKKKQQIVEAAISRGMSVSSFMVWLFDEYYKKASKAEARNASRG